MPSIETSPALGKSRAVHHFQRGGLAGPAPAEEHQRLAGFHIETEIVENDFLTEASRHFPE